MNSTLYVPATLDLPESSQVTWQVAFWTLAALMVNAMAQPGGRICNLPSRYRTYLRCSPLLCFADVASIIIHFLVNKSYLGLSILESFAVILHEKFDLTASDPSSEFPARFRDSSMAPDSDEAELFNLEKATFLRWLWFIFGTLPPTIKLFAMDGMPWTKTWGVMFLSSWIVNEGLVLLAALNQHFLTVSSNGHTSWTGYERVASLIQWKQSRTLLVNCQHSLAVTGLTIHVVAMNLIFRVLWRELTLGTDYPLAGTIWQESNKPGKRSTIFGARYTLAVTALILPMIGCLALLPRRMTKFLLDMSHLSWILFGLQLFAINAVADCATYGTNSSQSAEIVFVSTSIVVSVFLALVGWICKQFVMLGRNLLVLYLEKNGGPVRVELDYLSCLSLVFFLSTVAACVLWYCYFFDPADTYNPTWTGVFG